MKSGTILGLSPVVVYLSPMRLLLLPLLLTSLCFTARSQQFRLQGTAVQSGPLSYTLTTEGLTQAGMITNIYPLDLRTSFSLNFQLNFGTLDANGADGFAFLLNNACTPQLGTGAGLGVTGINNSLIVEFDTWNNNAAFNDVPEDHIGIYSNGQLNQAGNVMDGTLQPVCMLPNCGNVEDGSWYDITIQWQYVSPLQQRLSVFFNGILRATSTRNHIMERFGNQPIVFWSVAASTGGNFNLQQFRLATGNNNIPACVGQPVTLVAPALGSNYRWSNSNPSTTNTAIYAAGSVGSFSCTYVDFCGDERTVFFRVDVFPNPAVTVDVQAGCAAQPATVTALPDALGTYLYTWTVPAGVTNPGSVPSFTTTVPGNYSVQIENAATTCRSQSASGTVSFTPAITPVFAAIPAICSGTIVNPLPGTSLNGINGSWSPAFNNSNTTTYTFTPDPAGPCAFPLTTTVIIEASPVVSLGADTIFCTGSSLQLQATATGNNLSYVWQNGSTQPTQTVTRAGTYWVRVFNACGSATDTIEVREQVCQVFIPTAFTPNGDGLNDVFRISGADLVTDFSMQVFNRWGQPVYQSTNALQGWDGRLRGERQPKGVYAYRIRYIEVATGQQVQRSGTFTLLY